MHLHRLGAVAGVLLAATAVAAPTASAKPKPAPKVKIVKSTAKTPKGYTCKRQRRHGVMVKVCTKRPTTGTSAPSTSAPPVTSAPSTSAPAQTPPETPVAPVATVPDTTPAPAGPSGPSGPSGPPSPPAPPAVTASTAVSNWEETSGWATDTFTRVLSITNNGAVPPATCYSTATVCWSYTATLTDTGTFVAHTGAARPNTSLNGTIAGSPSGTMNGQATIEFYADQQPNASLVPTAVNGRASITPVGTASWPTMAFADSTRFELTSADPYAPLTSYTWVYASSCETWTDSYPGSDGQAPADGNITHACS